MNIVIVESPAKAKTVNKYLGSGYRVLASYGHVRDLPSKNGSVLPYKDFEMHWDVEPKAAKRRHTQPDRPRDVAERVAALVAVFVRIRQRAGAYAVEHDDDDSGKRGGHG